MRGQNGVHLQIDTVNTTLLKHLLILCKIWKTGHKTDT
jgi:hypothetical protein